MLLGWDGHILHRQGPLYEVLNPPLADVAFRVIQRELDRYLPFLATTKVLIAAVRAGMGREAAHEVIKEHAVAVIAYNEARCKRLRGFLAKREKV